MSQENFDNLFYGASSVIRQFAKDIRTRMTPSEKILWSELRNKKLDGLKFRRQHPIEYYIADFYCHEKKLVIEIDGEIHLYQKQYDIGRTAELERFGIQVIRFKNEDVLFRVSSVLSQISDCCSRINIEV
ncbi:endonuclease domain-containing protein [Carboxylicivirga sediminis]|uniref:Endonuclease domain-containing protein n=1 Tax=Carboxylicivirga sediminis TaxID=2006564 RepID=A0A941IT19_9BACT|nr:endonuclease domain-containing protein [Carboxylicivirga sediminis]MBR8534091.1 endonuclease domain-containing protein [Carboxylicivirga sediminis]